MIEKIKLSKITEIKWKTRINRKKNSYQRLKNKMIKYPKKNKTYNVKYNHSHLI
jgi:hypothetical protein